MMFKKANSMAYCCGSGSHDANGNISIKRKSAFSKELQEAGSFLHKVLLGNEYTAFMVSMILKVELSVCVCAHARATVSTGINLSHPN